jgi:hypothetical protein
VITKEDIQLEPHADGVRFFVVFDGRTFATVYASEPDEREEDLECARDILDEMIWLYLRHGPDPKCSKCEDAAQFRVLGQWTGIEEFRCERHTPSSFSDAAEIASRLGSVPSPYELQQLKQGRIVQLDQTAIEDGDS